MKFYKCAAAVFFFLTAGIAGAAEIAVYNIEGRQVRAAEGELLLKFKEGVSKSKRDLVLSGAGAYRKGRIKALGVDILKIEKGRVFEDVLKALARNPKVEYAEPNYIYSAQKLPREYDTMIEMERSQWGLVRSMFPQAWEYSTGCADVVIAVVDSYVDINHPDLKDNIHDIRVNFISGESSEYPPDPGNENHGTHVAGIAAAAERGIGIVGGNWNAKIMPMRALKYSNFSNGEEGDIKDIAIAISSAAFHGADVINLSIGSTTRSELLKDAVKQAYEAGVLLVGASGNNSNDTKHYPAAYEEVMAVGASDKNNRKADFSTYGEWVDMAAPGVSILSTLPGGIYGEFKGTSMAAPFVSAAAALLISYMRVEGDWPLEREDVGEEKLEYLKDLIVSSASDYSSFGMGSGILNAYGALSAAAEFDGEECKIIIYPNPFDPLEEHAVIRMPPGSDEFFRSLKVFSLDGRLIKHKEWDGSGVTNWSGKNDDNFLVAPGLYFVMAETGDGKRKRGKVTVLRR